MIPAAVEGPLTFVSPTEFAVSLLLVGYFLSTACVVTVVDALSFRDGDPGRLGTGEGRGIIGYTTNTPGYRSLLVDATTTLWRQAVGCGHVCLTRTGQRQISWLPWRSCTALFGGVDEANGRWVFETWWVVACVLD